MQQEEHRGGVGRGNNRANQHRLDPAQAEHVLRDVRGERSGQHHADGRKRHRRTKHVAKGRKARAQAAVEQDQGERDRAHDIGRAHVVEANAAGPRFARQHADQQEYEQQRRAEAHGDQARQDAGEHQQRAKQNDDADGVESGHESRRSLWVCPHSDMRIAGNANRGTSRPSPFEAPPAQEAGVAPQGDG